MRAGRHDLTTADQIVLDAIGRRLSAVEAELPRLRPWRDDRVAAGQLHVVRGRTRRVAARRHEAPGGPRFRVRIDVVATALAAALAVAVLSSGHGADVGRSTSISAATPPGPAFSFGPDPATDPSGAPGAAASGPAPTPDPTRPPGSVRPTPGSPEREAPPTALRPAGVQAVLGRMGWRCGVLVQVALEPLGPALIDKLAATTGDRGGYLPDGLGPGWVGSDPLLAAGAFKARLLVADADGSLWVVRGDGADAVVFQLIHESGLSGATAWRSADVLWPTACPPLGTDPKSLISKRSPGDWPAGRIVDLAVVRVVPFATAIARPR